MDQPYMIMETAVGFLSGTRIALSSIGTRQAEGESFLGVNVYVDGKLHENARPGDTFVVNGDSWRMQKLEAAEPPQRGKVWFERLDPEPSK